MKLSIALLFALVACLLLAVSSALDDNDLKRFKDEKQEENKPEVRARRALGETEPKIQGQPKLADKEAEKLKYSELFKYTEENKPEVRARRALGETEPKIQGQRKFADKEDKELKYSEFFKEMADKSPALKELDTKTAEEKDALKRAFQAAELKVFARKSPETKPSDEPIPEDEFSA